MYKLGREVAGEWVEHSHPPLFSTERVGERERLRIGVPGGDPLVLRGLARQLQEPLFILYVLHTPRGEGEEGRYQSPEVSYAEVSGFIDEHAAFLRGDARFDIWIYSPQMEATLAWDRHNWLFAYGPLVPFRAELHALGFQEGRLEPLPDHMHHYRHELDAKAASVLAAFDWHRTPLRPGDEQ